MAAHTCALFRSAAFLDEVGIQTDWETMAWTNDSTQVPPKTEETAVQMDSAPERWCAALQMELPNDERPHSPKVHLIAMTANACTQNVSNTKQMELQAYDSLQQSSPAPKTRPK
jgi:hypothetical protein